jgi:hypothetical protein
MRAAQSLYRRTGRFVLIFAEIALAVIIPYRAYQTWAIVRSGYVKGMGDNEVDLGN